MSADPSKVSDRRPATGVRYTLERRVVDAEHAMYEGFAHLPAADVPLVVRIDLPAGTIRATATPTGNISSARAEELAKAVAPLVRAATKAEIAAGQELPRKIVRWRG